MVMSNMAARAREEFRGFRRQLPAQHLAHDQISLNRWMRLELVIRGWLHREGLMPTFFKVEAISG